MTSIDARKAQIEARIVELRARLARIGGELEEPLSEDFEEQAVEIEDDEVLEDLGAASQQEIRALQAALGRIADGTYGTCVNCGEPIGEERLDAVPQAPRCRTCAG